jgi:biopolymer transport protein ExbD
MAEIIQNEGDGKKKGKKRAKKHSTHVDMTPMVDLACLLLTFFMLTTAFSKPKVMEIVMPDKKPGPETKIPKWRVLNIILDENDKIYWYSGNANPLEPPLPEIQETDYSKDGIRKVLLHRNKDLFVKIEQFNQNVVKGKIVMPHDTATKRVKEFKKDDQKGPIVLIKATDKVKYGNVVNILDEMAITDVARYAIVDLNKIEKKMLADYKKLHP